MVVTKGAKIKLIKDLEDPYTPKRAGDIMTVNYVDDAGQIHGHWESGGSLALIIGVDEFEVVE